MSTNQINNKFFLPHSDDDDDDDDNADTPKSVPNMSAIIGDVKSEVLKRDEQNNCNDNNLAVIGPEPVFDSSSDQIHDKDATTEDNDDIIGNLVRPDGTEPNINISECNKDENKSTALELNKDGAVLTSTEVTPDSRDTASNAEASSNTEAFLSLVDNHNTSSNREAIKIVVDDPNNGVLRSSTTNTEEITSEDNNPNTSSKTEASICDTEHNLNESGTQPKNSRLSECEYEADNRANADTIKLNTSSAIYCDSGASKSICTTMEAPAATYDIPKAFSFATASSETNSDGSNFPSYLTPRTSRSINSESNSKSSSGGSFSFGQISEGPDFRGTSNYSGHGSPDSSFKASCDIIRKPNFVFDKPRSELLDKTASTSEPTHSLFGKQVQWNTGPATPNNSDTSSINVSDSDKPDPTIFKSGESINDTTESAGAIPKTTCSFESPKSDTSISTSMKSAPTYLSLAPSSVTSSAVGSNLTSTLTTISSFGSGVTTTTDDVPKTELIKDSDASTTTGLISATTDTSIETPNAVSSNSSGITTGAMPKSRFNFWIPNTNDKSSTSGTNSGAANSSETTTGAMPKSRFNFGTPNTESSTSTSNKSSTSGTNFGAANSSETSTRAMPKSRFNFGIPNTESSTSTSNKSSTSGTNSGAANSSDNTTGATPKSRFNFGIPNTESSTSTSNKSSTSGTNSGASNSSENTTRATPKSRFNFGIPNTESSTSTSNKSSTSGTNSGAANSSDNSPLITGAVPKSRFSFGIPKAGSSEPTSSTSTNKSSGATNSSATTTGTTLKPSFAISETKSGFSFGIPKTACSSNVTNSDVASSGTLPKTPFSSNMQTKPSFSFGLPNKSPNTTNSNLTPIFGAPSASTTPIFDFASSSKNMVQSFKKVLAKNSSQDSNKPGFVFGNSQGGFANVTGFYTNRTANVTDCSGTGVVRYNPVKNVDIVIRSGESKTVDVNICVISCMREYETKSIEELRHEDYLAGRKGRTHHECAFCTPGAICVYDKNFAPNGWTYTDIFNKSMQGNVFGRPASKIITTDGRGTGVIRYKPTATVDENNCNICVISVMKEYETKSLDELRYEDYMAKRQGQSTHKCSFCPSDYYCSFDKKYNTKPQDNSSPNTSAFGTSGSAKSVFPSMFGANSLRSAFGTSPSSVPFGTPPSNIQFGTTASNSTFGASASNIAFGTTTSNSNFGASASNIAFGTPACNNTFGASASNIAFGTPASGSPFGTRNNGPFGGTSSNATPIYKSLFGFPNSSGLSSPNTAFNTPSTSKGIFGITSTTQSNAPSTNPAIFGSSSTAFNAPSTTRGIFDPTNTISTASSTDTAIFGQSNTSQFNSVFRSSSTAFNAPSITRSIFDPTNALSTDSSTDTTTFGSTTAAFNAPSASKSIFGQPSTAQSNFAMFGATSTAVNAPSTSRGIFDPTNTISTASSTNTTKFGSTTATFNAPSTSKGIFGQPSTAQSNFAMFGATSTAVNAPSTTRGILDPTNTISTASSTNTTKFGSTTATFNAPSTSKGIFGQPSTAKSNFAMFGATSTAVNAPGTTRDILDPTNTISTVSSTNTTKFGSTTATFNAPSTSKGLFGPPSTTQLNSATTNTVTFGSPSTTFNMPSITRGIFDASAASNPSNTNINSGTSTATTASNSGSVFLGLTNNSIQVANTNASLFGTGSTGAIFEPNNNFVTSPRTVSSIFNDARSSLGSNSGIVSSTNSTTAPITSATSQIFSGNRNVPVTQSATSNLIGGNQATTDGIDGNSSSCPYPYIPNNGSRQTNSSRFGTGSTGGTRAGATGTSNRMPNSNSMTTTGINSTNTSSNAVATTSGNRVAAAISNSIANSNIQGTTTNTGNTLNNTTTAGYSNATTSNILSTASTVGNSNAISSNISGVTATGVPNTSDNGVASITNYSSNFATASTSHASFHDTNVAGPSTSQTEDYIELSLNMVERWNTVLKKQLSEVNKFALKAKYAIPINTNGAGSSTSEMENTYQNIPPNVIARWNDILNKGLSDSSKTALQQQYSIPENMGLLKAPTMNPEIANNDQMTEELKSTDKKIQNQQDLLGNGIVAIIKAMDLLLSKEGAPYVFRALFNSVRLLTDLHFNMTKERGDHILPLLEDNVRDILMERERDATIFGSDMSEMDVGNMFKTIPTNHDIAEANSGSDLNQSEAAQTSQLLESISDFKVTIMTKIDQLIEKVDSINDERERDGESISTPSADNEDGSNSASISSEDLTNDEDNLPLDDKFQPGNYVVLKSDIQWDGLTMINNLRELTIYFVVSGMLVNKYTSLHDYEEDTLQSVIYNQSKQYTGWSKKRSEDFYSITSAVVENEPKSNYSKRITVRFDDLARLLVGERAVDFDRGMR